MDDTPFSETTNYCNYKKAVTGGLVARVKWTKVKGRFHYLNLLHRGDDVLGFIMQQGPESQFNCNVGLNDDFRFIGHKRNSISAKDFVEETVSKLGI